MAERAAGARALDLRLGGAAAAAEAAWMGVPLATEALEPARLPRVRLPRPPAPRIRPRGLLNREFGIAGATVLLMASFFFSAGLGAVRQVVFNAIFGAGSEASAYYAAFRLPDTLFSLIAGGALSTALIPVLLGAVRDEGEEAGWRLASLVLNALLAIVLVVTVIGEICAPLFVDNLLVPGFDAETRSLTVTLTRIMLLQPAILIIGTVATALLNSRNQFLLTALSVASHNIALICGITAAAAWPRLGIYGPTFGVIGGAMLQTLVLLPGLEGTGARYIPRWNLRDERLQEVGRLLLPNGLAVGVGYAGFIVDTAFASRAGDRASLAAIQNAWLLVGLPIALLGQAVGQAAFPRLAAHAGRGDIPQLRGTLVRALAVMCGLAVVGVAGMVVLGRPVIRVLFEHGDFTSGNGDLTARVLLVYALGLPAYVATEVLVRALLAMRDARTQLYTNSAQLVLRIVIVALLLDRFQARAIPFAFAISAALETCALLVITFRRIARLERGSTRSVRGAVDRPSVVPADQAKA